MRPTKYSARIVKKTKQYLAEYKSTGDVIPSISGLSIYLNIARSTLNKWRDEEGKEAFSDILGAILVTQENVLINEGLKGNFNAAIAKLALGKHGYKENTDITSGGDKIKNEWHVYPVTTIKE